MSDFITYQFRNCEVRYFPAADYLETVFQDGAKCPAQFTFFKADYEKAFELGYKGSYSWSRSPVTQMHCEHELSHTFIAEALGEPWCPVLRSVAVKGPCEGAWEREALVMDWQRYLNGAAATPRMIDALNGGGAGVIASMIDFCRRFRS